MVIFEVRAGERMAMPLSLVERIESVPVGEIEFAGGSVVLQYRGDVLLLEDEGEVLRELRVAAGEGDAATVLICLRPGARGMKRVGVVVRQVLDITAGTLLAEDAAEFDGRLAMVKDRVTTVHRGSMELAGESADGSASAMLQEVA
jgi:two-component system, chemotaxis family, sensor kinase CheA